ncbi:hypothetical protein CI610_02907 [invertebrate metagenome]|uniref:SGNH hydrolase-type esterase domain-containing protein n=1 Tax=invertebrate metagenome TaxID=1711999 RepID=A0A2H9T4L8_9ZZZZ
MNRCVLFSDSRFAGARLVDIALNVSRGSGLCDQVRYLQNFNHTGYKLYIICAGINDIPDNIGYYLEQEQINKYNYLTKKILDIEHEIKTHNPTAQVIFGTIPPKDLKISIRKYPHKSPSTICSNHKTPTEIRRVCSEA